MTTQANSKTAHASQSFDGECDILVIGAGIAGATTALTASDELGADGRVILLEADSYIGGSFAMAGGAANGEVSAANKDGNISPDWGTWYGGAPGIKGNGKGQGLNSLRFSQENGYPDSGKLTKVAAYAYGLRKDSFPAWGIPVTGKPDDSGNFIFLDPNDPGIKGGPAGARSFARALENRDVSKGGNIRLFLNTRVKSFIFDDKNIVIGVNTEDTRAGNITKYRFGGKKIIITTGGYSRNNKMLAEYVAEETNPGLKKMAQADWFRASTAKYHLGDGISLALSAGGVLQKEHYITFDNGGYGAGYDRDFPERLPVSPVNYRSALGANVFMDKPLIQMKNYITVNGEGRRFASEDENIGIVRGSFGNKMIADGKPPYHVIFNSSPYMSPDGSWNLVDALNAGADLTSQIEILRDETLSGLAVKMGMAPAGVSNFLITVDTYNGYVEARCDKDFNKAPELLTVKFIDGSAGNGPFFAVKVYPGSLSSWGGVETDWRCRLLGKDGNVIPNLYTAGEVTDRDMFNGLYIGATSLIICPAQGKIAAIDAVSLLKGGSGAPDLVKFA